MISRWLLPALILPVTVLAQSVTVTVNTGTAVRIVDERVFGLNAAVWDSQVDTASTLSLVEPLGLRAIRIGAGYNADIYSWRHNLFRDSNNPSQVLTSNASVFRGMRALAPVPNGQVMVTTNYGTGSPEEAAAWVAYANGSSTSTVPLGVDGYGYDWKHAGFWASMRAGSPGIPDDGMNFLRIARASPYGLKYWEIGGAVYDAQVISLPANDPVVYAQRAKAYIEKMKAVDPSIKVGVVVTASETDHANGSSRTVTNPRTGASHTGWTPVMLTTLRELGVTPDFVSYHRYEQTPFVSIAAGGWEDDARLLQAAKAWPDHAANLRRMLNDYLGSAGPGVEILVTAANSMHWRVPGKQSTSLVNGLFLADSLGYVLQTEINGFWWWALHNSDEVDGNNSASLYGWRTYGNLGILHHAQEGMGFAGSQDPHPTYYAMKLISRFARPGDTVVQATSNSSLLSVFAVKTTAGQVNLLVINKDPANALNASIALNGFSPATTANVLSYGKPQDDAARPGGTGSRDLAASSMDVAGSNFSTSFAPYSMSVIALAPPVATPITPTTPSSPASPSTPSVPSAPAGSGGGGGGAPSSWLLGVLTMLVSGRWLIRSRA